MPGITRPLSPFGDFDRLFSSPAAFPFSSPSIIIVNNETNPPFTTATTTIVFFYRPTHLHALYCPVAMPSTTTTAPIIATQQEKFPDALMDGPASLSEPDLGQPEPSESARVSAAGPAAVANGITHADSFSLDEERAPVAEKSPSISSLSSLSSSSPEPSHDLLPPVAAPGTINLPIHEEDDDDDLGESEAETERLDPGELKALDELENKQRASTLHRIEEIGLQNEIVSEVNPELLNQEAAITDVPSSPVLKKRPLQDDAVAPSAVPSTESKQSEESPKRLKADSLPEPVLSDAPEMAPEAVSEKPAPSEHESVPDVDMDEQIEDVAAAEPEEHAPSEEDIQAQRKEAISFLTEIEVEFAKLRDSIHADKMARFVAEIEMCAEGTHPDLASTYTQIENLRNEKIRRAKKRREYERICIDNQIRASRDQLHQQYLKDTADTRANLLLKTTEEWYRVNRERRVMDALVPEYGYRVSKDVAVQTIERKARDKEVQILSDLGRNVGFPAAPEMKAGTEEEIEEDLQLLNMAMAQRRF